jgi:hypothetical protein
VFADQQSQGSPIDRIEIPRSFAFEWSMSTWMTGTGVDSGGCWSPGSSPGMIAREH